MTEVADEVFEVVGDPEVSRSRKRLSWVGRISLLWLTLACATAIAAPWLPIAATTDSSVSLARKGPSLAHPFGGDTIGKDLFSLSIWGSRTSLMVGFLSVFLGILVGGSLGVCAGYMRGKFDSLISVVFDTLLSIPAILLAVSLVAISDPPDLSKGSPYSRVAWIAFAIGVVSIPILGRISRAATLAVADREFVLAAKGLGAKQWRVIVREVLPNVLPAILSIGLLGMGVAIVAEGSLALLGAGVRSPVTSWGSIIASNRSNLQSQPWSVFGPGMLIFLTVMALNVMGDELRRFFDVREAQI